MTTLVEHAGVEPLTLSGALRTQTAQAHATAEGSSFMTELMAGRLSREAVADYAGQLWFIYDALERAQRTVASPVHDARLERREALESDLDHLVGPRWRTDIRLLPATARYVCRLESMDHFPQATSVAVAHHYVRYLGDVSGGQAIARLLAERYGLNKTELSFYDFSAIGKIPHFRTEYRERLDTLGAAGAVDIADCVAEAARAFELNTAVFEQLAQRWVA